MKQSIILALPFIGASVARPDVWSVHSKREVPQEHSHRNVNLEVTKSLNVNNPDKIQDPVFGLLGAAAGIKGAGNIKDADCLQQAIADQAFTNAKAANDVNGMTFAMIYRALERNTGAVGLASVPCTSIKAVNPEIAALQQHQDPAGQGAQALNKQIAQTLASQIAAIGGDPALANEASTFAPGTVGDPTAAGNTCDDDQDALGCINSQKLRVDDLTAAEIKAAASGAGAAASGAGAAASGAGAAAGGKNSAAAGGNANSNQAAAGNKAATGNQAKGVKAGGAKAGGQAASGSSAASDASCASSNASGAASNASGAASNASGAAPNASGAKSNASGASAATGATGAATGGAGAADFGSCADPTVVFGTPSDGRQEDAFEASDLTNFPHGSALNIGVISAFICDQLTNKCKASADAVTKCDAADAQVKASGLKGQAAADSFNQALGL